MKTWKKIEDAKKRTNDIASSKKRNEEKVQKVLLHDDLKYMFRKSTICSLTSKSRNKNLKLTTWSKSRDKRKKKRSKRQYISQSERKPSSPRQWKPNWNPVEHKSRWKVTKITKWRTSLSYSRSVSPSWRSRRKRSAGFNRCIGTWIASSMTRRASARWRSRRSCRWRCSRWNSSRSYKTRRQYRRRHTLSSRRRSRNPAK